MERIYHARLAESRQGDAWQACLRWPQLPGFQEGLRCRPVLSRDWPSGTQTLRRQARDDGHATGRISRRRMLENFMGTRGQRLASLLLLLLFPAMAAAE